jgi:hypothetical protein
MPDHTTIADERGTVRKLALQGLRRAGADDPLFAPAPVDAPRRAIDLILADVILADVNLAGTRADGARVDSPPGAPDGSNGSGARGREAQ